MASRKILPEVKAVFDKYISSSMARRLSRQDALRMLQTEFVLTQSRSEELFDHYDADQNGHMSLWEFQHFYKIVGNRINDIVKQFEELDSDQRNYLNPEQGRSALRTMSTSEGQPLEDKEIEFFLKTAIGEKETLTLGEFVDLHARIRMYKRPPSKK